MKPLYIYIVAFVLMCMPILAQASVQLGDYNAGLVGYWSLNEGVGSAAYDTSGGNNLATFTGSPSWVAGKFNNALQFAGTPQVASTSLAWPSTGGTIVLWVYPTTYSNWISPAGWKLLGATNGYMLIDEGGGGTPGTWRFVTRLDNSGATEAGVTASASIVQNTWQQLIATWSKSGSTYTIHLYVNGVDQGSTTWTGTPGAGGVGHFHFGNSGDYPDNYFLGNVDDVRVYNYAVSASQAKALYQTGTPNVTVGKSSPTSLTSGLVGYWTMDGKNINWNTYVLSGLDAAGHSANINTVGLSTPMSTTTAPVAGKVGQALLFRGGTSSGDLLSIGGGSNFSITNTATFSAWIQMTSYPATRMGVLSDRGGSSGVNFDVSGSGDACGQGKLEILEGGSGATCGSATLSLNKWYHVVAVLNGNTRLLYVNGVLDSSTSGAWTWPNNGATVGSGNGFANYFFSGALDDVHIYNRALSATEVAHLYANGGGTIAQSNTTANASGLVGQWTFDGKTVNWVTGVAADSSGQGNNGSLINMSTTTSPAAGKTGQALLFNGSNTEVRIADPGTFDPSAITVSAWIYSTGADPSAGAERIVDKANASTMTQNGFRLAAYTATNCGTSNPQWGFQWYNGSARLLCGPVIASTTNKWTHIVFTHDGTTGRIYTNGALLGSLTTPYTGSSAFNVVIGNSDQVSKPFTGKIDDVRIYNRALSATEVAHLYAAGK